MRFSPDGSLFATTDGSSSINVWHLDSKTPEKVFQTIATNGSASPLFSPNNDLIAMAGTDEIVVRLVDKDQAAGKIKMEEGRPATAYLAGIRQKSG